MEHKYLTIGKTAKIMNVTVKALRFYDKLGLLKPEYIDPETKYRYYSVDQLIYIDLIKAARNLDISPNTLVPYFVEKDTDKLIGLMHRHKDMLSEKMNRLQKTIDQIETIENVLEKAEYIDKSGNIYLKDIPDRYTVTRTLDIKQSQDNINKDFYLLNASLNQMRLTSMYEDGIIYSLSKDTLWSEFIYTCVLKDKELHDYRLLPGGIYLCTVFQKENAQEQYIKLLEYASDHSLKPQFIVQTGLLINFFADMPEYFEAQMKVDIT